MCAVLLVACVCADLTYGYASHASFPRLATLQQRLWWQRRKRTQLCKQWI